MQRICASILSYRSNFLIHWASYHSYTIKCWSPGETFAVFANRLCFTTKIFPASSRYLEHLNRQRGQTAKIFPTVDELRKLPLEQFIV